MGFSTNSPTSGQLFSSYTTASREPKQGERSTRPAEMPELTEQPPAGERIPGTLSPGSPTESSRKTSCRPNSSRSALGHRQIGTEQGRLGGRAFLSFSCVPVNPNVKGDYMPHSRIVPPLLAALKQMGIPQREVAQILGCSSSLISLVSAGERSLTIPDLEGLLKRLAALYPQHRAELAEAALGPLLADLGCEVRVLSGPPPAAPAGKVVILSEWRSQRELRRAA